MTSGDAVTLQDMEGRILAWNPMAEKDVRYGSETEALAINCQQNSPGETKKREALTLLKKLVQADVPENLAGQKRLTKDGPDCRCLDYSYPHGKCRW